MYLNQEYLDLYTVVVFVVSWPPGWAVYNIYSIDSIAHELLGPFYPKWAFSHILQSLPFPAPALWMLFATPGQVWQSWRSGRLEMAFRPWARQGSDIGKSWWL